MDDSRTLALKLEAAKAVHQRDFQKKENTALRLLLSAVENHSAIWAKKSAHENAGLRAMSQRAAKLHSAQLEQHRRRLNQLMIENASVRTELQDSKDQLENSRGELQANKDRLVLAETREARLLTDLASKDQQIGALVSENANLKASVEVAEVLRGNLEKRDLGLAEITTKLQTYMVDMEKVNSELRSTKSALLDAQKELKSQGRVESALNERVQSLEKDLKSALTEMKSYEKETSGASRSLERLKAEFENEKKMWEMQKVMLERELKNMGAERKARASSQKKAALSEEPEENDVRSNRPESTRIINSLDRYECATGLNTEKPIEEKPQNDIAGDKRPFKRSDIKVKETVRHGTEEADAANAKTKNPPKIKKTKMSDGKTTKKTVKIQTPVDDEDESVQRQEAGGYDSVIVDVTRGPKEKGPGNWKLATDNKSPSKQNGEVEKSEHEEPATAFSKKTKRGKDQNQGSDAEAGDDSVEPARKQHIRAKSRNADVNKQVEVESDLAAKEKKSAELNATGRSVRQSRSRPPGEWWKNKATNLETSPHGRGNTLRDRLALDESVTSAPLKSPRRASEEKLESKSSKKNQGHKSDSREASPSPRRPVEKEPESPKELALGDKALKTAAKSMKSSKFPADPAFDKDIDKRSDTSNKMGRSHEVTADVKTKKRDRAGRAEEILALDDKTGDASSRINEGADEESSRKKRQKTASTPHKKLQTKSLPREVGHRERGEPKERSDDPAQIPQGAEAVKPSTPGKSSSFIYSFKPSNVVSAPTSTAINFQSVGTAPDTTAAISFMPPRMSHKQQRLQSILQGSRV